ncbi:uncharacterized protein LOC124173380 [Ischnura elegans]|uniref:uncharacterized protein LOC124173380 n=1 Tax=Ischnura elegans TaxID=197161 RepID=UPI001ED87214|nr:uncharacterized protein LOC124173380 [Ischnura elegans]
MSSKSPILRRFNITSIHLPPPKLRDYLVRAKDPVGLKTPGVYRVPCECGEAYIGETGCTIETRLKEHKRHLRLGQPEKSAIAEHSIQHDHVIQFDDTEILTRSTKYWDRVVKEAIEIRLDHKNFDRDAGYAISNTWKPVLSALKSQRINGWLPRDQSSTNHVTPDLQARYIRESNPQSDIQLP